MTHDSLLAQYRLAILENEKICDCNRCQTQHEKIEAIAAEAHALQALQAHVAELNNKIARLEFQAELQDEFYGDSLYAKRIEKKG
jgi:hypothetical protein